LPPRLFEALARRGLGEAATAAAVLEPTLPHLETEVLWRDEANRSAWRIPVAGRHFLLHDRASKIAYVRLSAALSTNLAGDAPPAATPADPAPPVVRQAILAEIDSLRRAGTYRDAQLDDFQRAVGIAD
jgi:hypothetical protein